MGSECQPWELPYRSASCMFQKIFSCLVLYPERSKVLLWNSTARVQGKEIMCKFRWICTQNAEVKTFFLCISLITSFLSLNINFFLLFIYLSYHLFFKFEHLYEVLRWLISRGWRFSNSLLGYHDWELFREKTWTWFGK